MTSAVSILSFRRVAAVALSLLLALAGPLAAQTLPVPPPRTDPRILDIANATSPERVEQDIRALVSFGTRNTLSDTVSDTRGIGAARRWIKAQFDSISQECGGCLEVSYQGYVQTEDVPHPVRVVNVLAIQRGTVHPDRYVIMSGDIDSRASRTMDDTTDAPGANDNASGIAGVLEAARVLTKYTFGSSIIFVGLSGEEQGLWGGTYMAQQAQEAGWDIAAMMNNDMIGNIEGINGVTANNTFRVFSEPMSQTLTDRERASIRRYGGEVDGPSRELARYIDRIADLYFPNLDAIMIYRLDRFGRGGHHRPFNDAGYPAVRVMETHENYTRQHQNVRTENGIAYGDVISGVSFPYVAKMAALNATVLASLAWAPPAPDSVLIGGAVSASTHLAWSAVQDPNLAGYRVYWRDTTAPQWQHSRFVGHITEYTLENIIIDNYLFGVAAVGKNGDESPVVFPNGLLRRRR